MNDKAYTILVVDDSKSIRAYLKALICEYVPGVQVDTLSSSQEAFEYMQKHRVDLILLDILMPEIDGFEFAASLKKEKAFHNIPIIFITASIHKDDFVKKGFSLGAIDYIKKPFDEVLLANKINTYVKLFKKEDELKASYKMIYNILSHMDSMLMIVKEGEIVQVNKTFLSFFGLDSLLKFQETYSCVGSLFIDDKDCLPKGLNTNEVIKHALDNPNKEAKVKIKDCVGKNHWFVLKISYLHELAVQSNEYIISFTDITQTETLKKSYEHQAQNDSLTRLNNRYAFNLRLGEVFENVQSALHNSVAVIMLDIDHFKKINDQYGHNVGDTVLHHFADCIKSSLSLDDDIARWGGEEFIVLSKKRDENSLKKLLEAVRHSVEKCDFSGIDTLTCSLGASFLQEGDSQSTLINRADLALYEAKSDGRNRWNLL